MANIVSPHHHLDLPPLESLDRNHIEVFYDADLDEMSILFYGREQPNYVDPVNDVLAALRDTGSDVVVGVVFSRFLKQVILDVPESRIFFDDATILTGDHALDPPSNGPAHPSLATRLQSATRAALRAMKQGWASGVAVDADEQRRRVFQAIPTLCP
ncbi:MAG: hypothetical protein M3457_22705 [Chloroflexota bacterium]|nr:hypothetical protein [Chloroflexota bacterium]